MTTRCLNWRQLFSVVLLALSVIAGELRLLALAGNLDRPSLALSESMNPEWRERVIKVLNEPASEFLGGRFINAVTTLRYGGNTEALNRFIGGIAGCPGARIEITFVRSLDANWILEHNGWADERQFLLKIVFGSESIRLEELRLPEIVGSDDRSSTEKRL